MTKRCSCCKRTKTITDFHRDRCTKDGRHGECRVCRSKKATELPSTRARRLRRHLVTPEQYDQILRAQEGVCAICGGPRGKRSLHVDHDHETGAVRGLLCHNCNIGLGNFKDDPDLLLAAAYYLIRSGESLTAQLVNMIA